MLFVLVAIGYLLISFMIPLPQGMSLTNGDEPHYLLMAHSLIYDHDLDLTNNYENRDYAPYYQGELERHQFRVPGTSRIVPHHQVGLPILILPAYLMAGRNGVIIMLNLLMTIGIYNVYKTCLLYTERKQAFLISLLAAFNYPIVIYSHQIYPDTVAFVIVAYTIRKILYLKRENARSTALSVALALSTLPFLHIRFAIFSVLLFLFLLWRGRSYIAVLTRWSCVPIVASVVALYAWLYHLYGANLWAALMSISKSLGIPVRYPFVGVLGLLADQEFGLFIYAPLYMLSLSGFILLLREPRTRQDALAMGITYLCYHLLVGTYPDWAGGLSPVPRYLIPVLPILVIFLAKGVDCAPQRGKVIHTLALYMLNGAITLVILFNRLFMFGFGVGSNSMLRELGQEHLTVLLPSFWTRGFEDLPLLIVWTLLLLPYL